MRRLRVRQHLVGLGWYDEKGNSLDPVRIRGLQGYCSLAGCGALKTSFYLDASGGEVATCNVHFPQALADDLAAAEQRRPNQQTEEVT